MSAPESTEPDDPRMLARIERDGAEDVVAVEEPLEIRVDGAPLAVTMRTPGHDEELALGFLHGEGLIDRAHPAGLSDDLAGNVIDVRGPLLHEPGERSFYATSSCGVCGKGAIEQVAVLSGPIGDGPVLPRELLAALPERMRQPAFERSGGLHATGRFDSFGSLLCVREDVGRHNAMDKVIGRALIDGAIPIARASCASAAASPSSSSRRRPWPARRSSSASAPRARWRSSSRTSAG